MTDQPMTATEHAAHKAGEAIVEYALTLYRQEGTDLPTAVAVAMEMTIGRLRQVQGRLLDRAQEITINGRPQSEMSAEQAATAERVRIVKEIRAYASELRATSHTPTVGVALGAIVDSVADRVNTFGA